jgi:hypothetical protein
MDSSKQVDDAQTLRFFPLSRNRPNVTMLVLTRSQLIFVNCDPGLADCLKQNASGWSCLQLEFGGWLPLGIRVSVP